MTTINNKVGRPERKPVTEAVAKQLNELYNKEYNFFGRDKLFKLAQEKGINVSRRQLFEWLQNQNVYQLYKAPRLTKNIKRTILSRPNQQVGIDLIDMQNSEYNGYKYILTAIDLFSKKAYALPLKNKKGVTVQKAMKKLLEKDLSGVSSIRSDRGSEFIDKDFKKLLKDFDVKQVLSSAHTPQSNGQIENFNKTLKRLINMALLADNSNNWISILQKLITNFNNTIHFITKKTPNELHQETKKNVLRKIRKKIKNKITKRRESDKVKFKLGDVVRIKINPDERTRSKEVWTRELYIVSKVFKPRKSTVAPSYKLKDDQGDDLKEMFYNNDLQKINKVENEIIAEPKYEVSSIIQPVMKGKQKAYEVRWLGYRKTTYEPRKTLLEDVPKLISAYEKNHKIVWSKVPKV